MSMTADGKAGLPGKDALERIGNRADLERMKKLRRESDAILAGAHTVRADNVALGVDPKSLRMINGLKYPLRICVMGEYVIDPDSRILNPELGGSTIMLIGKKRLEFAEKFYTNSIIRYVNKGYSVMLKKALIILENDYRIKNLLVEGGPTINGSLLEQDLIDRYYVTICPYLFSGQSRKCKTPVMGFPVENIHDRRFTLADVEKNDDWIFLTYDRKR